MSSSYNDYKAVVDLALQSYLHLHQFGRAQKLAESSAVVDQYTRVAVKEMADHPAKYILDDVAIIPFKNDELNPYMPSFDMEINGKPFVGQIDTGGNHVAMSPKLADELGIKYALIGYGNANDQKTRIWIGHADFRLGSVLVENASIYVLESLNGTIVESRPVFGTTLLSNFLVTLDYPGQRMILSPKGDHSSRAKHLSLLPAAETEMPFYLWADHYMFARGSIGSHSPLNFFVDTGLVVLDENNRQVAFYGHSETFRDWGYSESSLSNPYLDLNAPLRLGNLEQSGHRAFHTNHFNVTSLGGVKIHGLIAHAFLKNYIWTIDFEKRTYLFAQ